MECTQRLECTQDLYSSHCEKVIPEQIGFLGICGTKYPVKKGPNKIGRDSQTCSIVLNLNSISRQHAVINILNSKDFMLMDLDSANKTKLESKTLAPYIPHPLHNGDTVQFGDIFGIFRLIEEESDLPMTQAIDIPDTPLFNKHTYKLYNAPKTLVPESPDVSDKDESFIAASQKPDGRDFKSPKSRFIKSSGKTISIQPIGGNMIDNVYWKSSNKSLSLGESDISSVNNSRISDVIEENVDKSINIHELETQVPNSKDADESRDIYSANTQMPQDLPGSPSIHNMSTQLPVPSERLPQVCKISDQEDMQCDLFTANKENENIFSAETQQIVINKDKPKISLFDAESHDVNIVTSAVKSDIHNLETQKINLDEPITHLFDAETQQVADDFKEPIEIKVKPPDKEGLKNTKIMDDEILFDEIDGESFEENFESQAILPDNFHISPSKEHVEVISIASSEPRDDSPMSQAIKRVNRKVNQIDSDNSTDCEDMDMLLTQQIFDEEEVKSDCKDLERNKHDKKLSEDKQKLIEEDINNMATQILESDEIDIFKQNKSSDTDINVNNHGSDKDTCFAELATQIIIDDDIDIVHVKDTGQAVEANTFKVPVISPLKYKKKPDSIRSAKQSPKTVDTKPSTSKDDFDDEIYYTATQEIFDDLCSQKVPIDEDNLNANSEDDERVPCSVEDVVGERFPFLDDVPVKKDLVPADKLLKSDGDDVSKYVASLSSSQIRDVVGSEVVAKLNKTPSDPSDLEMTPKKKPFKFMNIDLPDSQEIKTSVARRVQNILTESSSESEVEQFSEECTPILFKKKTKKAKVDAKADLMKRFEVETSKPRILTRVRKPTAKMQYGDIETQKLAEKLFQTKQVREDLVDSEIITANMTRLRSKNEKSKCKNEVETPSTIAKDNSIKESKPLKDNKASDNTNEGLNLEKSVKGEKEVETTTESKLRRKETRSRTKVKEEKSILPQEHKITTNDLETTKTADKSGVRATRQRSSRNQKASADDKSKTSSKKKSKSPDKEKTRDIQPKEKETKSKVLEKEQSKTSKSTSDSKVEKQKRGRPKKELDNQEEIPNKRSRRRKEDKKEDERTNKKNVLQKEEIKEEVVKVIQTRSILKRSSGKPSFEQSAVYSVSSGSNPSSPVLKRQGSVISYPASKRSRSSTGSNNTSQSVTPGNAHKVLFTAFSLEALNEVKGKLEMLGAKTVTDVTDCTVLVTLQIKRTFKLLCAVGLGKPIVGPDWVQACVDGNTIVDPWKYIIKDEVAERRFGFSLESTLRGRRGYLRGYHVTSTPSVLPSAPELKLIVECSGGTWGEGGGARGGARGARAGRWVCVSSVADRAGWGALRGRGGTLVSTEFILAGVLRQACDIEANKLC